MQPDIPDYNYLDFFKNKFANLIDLLEMRKPKIRNGILA